MADGGIPVAGVARVLEPRLQRACEVGQVLGAFGVAGGGGPYCLPESLDCLVEVGEQSGLLEASRQREPEVGEVRCVDGVPGCFHYLAEGADRGIPVSGVVVPL